MWLTAALLMIAVYYVFGFEHPDGDYFFNSAIAAKIAESADPMA